MEKYLTPNPTLASLMQEQKKYRRESASGIDQFFSNDGDGLPYSINMNVFLPDITHLRTNLYKPQRPTVTHIKTEPVTVFSQQSEATAPQPLPEFTSIFSSHQNPDLNNIYIKQELPSPEIQIPVNPQHGQLYQLLSSSDIDLNSAGQTPVMDTISNASLSTELSGFNTLPSPVSQTTMKQFQGIPQCSYNMHGQFMTQQEATYFPPSPPSSEPGSPDRQAELLQSLNPPPSYAATIASKMGIHNSNLPATVPMTPTSVQQIRYNRRNNPDLEKRRIHYCDYPGKTLLVMTPWGQIVCFNAGMGNGVASLDLTPTM